MMQLTRQILVLNRIRISRKPSVVGKYSLFPISILTAVVDKASSRDILLLVFVALESMSEFATNLAHYGQLSTVHRTCADTMLPGLVAV
jgi:hypothetical protein